MTDQAGVMTLARAQIVAFRLQGLTLTALVEKGVLLPAEGAALVREAAGFLSAPTNDATVERLFAGALETIAGQIAGHRPQ